tara:strand:- start:758 stop:970 length:213 start_codon:yes stop_codon:yes gene_type:complete
LACSTTNRTANLTLNTEIAPVLLQPSTNATGTFTVRTGDETSHTANIAATLTNITFMDFTATTHCAGGGL